MGAGAGPSGIRGATIEATAAKIVAATQEHDGIAEEIQADGAGGFLLEIFHRVSRSHGRGDAVVLVFHEHPEKRPQRRGRAMVFREAGGRCWYPEPRGEKQRRVYRTFPPLQR